MAKKMILAIVNETDSVPVQDALYDSGYPLILMDATGGFLSGGSRTLISGVDEEDIDQVIELIDRHCSTSANPFKNRATIMVFDLDHFEQIP